MKLTLLSIILLLVTHIASAETGVARSVFSTAIENKEPVSDLQKISSAITRVYFFTELMGLSGHKISHRWEYQGKIMAEITFEIGADRWRTWSSKNMLSSWTGSWQVSVVDEGGNIIEQKSFEYIGESSPRADAETLTAPVSEGVP